MSTFPNHFFQRPHSAWRPWAIGSMRIDTKTSHNSLKSWTNHTTRAAANEDIPQMSSSFTRFKCKVLRIEVEGIELKAGVMMWCRKSCLFPYWFSQWLYFEIDPNCQMDFAEFQTTFQTNISWSVIWIHLIFQNLSKSVQQNTSCFQPGVGRAKWAGEAPKYMHNSTANFWWTKQIHANPNLTIYAKLCSNHITHVHGKSSKTVLKHQGNTTLSGNMQTYTQSPTFGQVLKGSILKAVCFVGANSLSSHRVRIVRQLVRRNWEASQWLRVPMDAVGTPAFWSCIHVQVPTLFLHPHPANSTQKSNNQAQRCSNVTTAYKIVDVCWWQYSSPCCYVLPDLCSV